MLLFFYEQYLKITLHVLRKKDFCIILPPSADHSKLLPLCSLPTRCLASGSANLWLLKPLFTPPHIRQHQANSVIQQEPLKNPLFFSHTHTYLTHSVWMKKTVRGTTELCDWSWVGGAYGYHWPLTSLWDQGGCDPSIIFFSFTHTHTLPH